MSNPMYRVSSTTALPALTVNRVLRNTYALLAMLFVFGGVVAYAAQTMHLRLGFWPFLIGIFAFSYAIAATRNSGWGLVFAFGFSGFLGLVTGGNVDAMLFRYGNGGERAHRASPSRSWSA